MRDDPPAAAFRLACALPVRTHEWRPATNAKPQRPYPRAATGGRRRGQGIARAIYIGKRRFESIKAAMTALRCSNGKIYGMLAAGDARYA